LNKFSHARDWKSIVRGVMAVMSLLDHKRLIYNKTCARPALKTVQVSLLN
jgi:hypothetical protein